MRKLCGGLCAGLPSVVALALIASAAGCKSAQERPLSPPAPPMVKAEASAMVPTDRVAPVARKPARNCVEVTALLAEVLRVGMTGAELKQALKDQRFVYREQAVMDLHHLAPAETGEARTQFGCVEGAEPSDGTIQGLDEGPIPTTRFFLRMAGARSATLAGFLAEPEATIIQLDKVTQDPEATRFAGAIG